MTITRVQGIAAISSGSTGGSTIVFTLGSPVGSGNSICGIASWDNSLADVISTIQDDKGNNYNVETKVLDTSQGQNAAAFSLTNITNGPTVITITLIAGLATFRAGVCDEFSGTSTVSSDERDGTAHGGQFQATPGTGTDGITSGNFTTTTNGDLLWGGSMDATSATLATVGTNYGTGTTMTTNYAIQSEFRVQATAGASTAATFTSAGGDPRSTFLIAIKPPTGADVLMPQIWM